MEKQIIYADNAATTKLNKQAFEAMQEFLLNDFSNASQPYSFSRRGKAALKQARETIAECINADPCEITFTSGGSESNNWVIKSFAHHNVNSDIISSSVEHHSIINSINAVRRFSNTTLLPVNMQGVVNENELLAAITRKTTLVSIMTANNEIGTIEPIKNLAEIAHGNNAVFHTDAVQAVGHIPIDVKALDIDFLSASAHKFNGPKGIGFLYRKNGSFLPPLIDGGSQENGNRAGTENIASIVGMAVALKHNITCMNSNSEQLSLLEAAFLRELESQRIDFIRNGYENHLPGNINISIRNSSGEMLLHRLDLQGIYVSTGSACDSVNTQISHVIKAIQVPDDYAKGTIRISLTADNSIGEVLQIAKAIAKIING